MEIKNHGFIAPEIMPDHYVLGVGLVPEIILQPDGQWLDYAPEGEKQSNEHIETYGCTCFNTNNPIEFMVRRLLQNEENYSDRYTYVVSETQPPGNDPHVVAEAIRSMGLVAESLLPFREDILSLPEFESFEDKDQQLFDQGKKWLERFDFKHEWVFNGDVTDSKERMMKALRLSPLGASVRAWQMRNGLYYKDPGQSDTHWTVIAGYVKEKYWIIYDSYPTADGSYIKHLEWDYPFGYSKRYHLAVKLPTEAAKPTHWFKRLIQILINMFKSILSPA